MEDLFYSYAFVRRREMRWGLLPASQPRRACSARASAAAATPSTCLLELATLAEHSLRSGSLSRALDSLDRGWEPGAPLSEDAAAATELYCRLSKISRHACSAGVHSPRASDTLLRHYAAHAPPDKILLHLTLHDAAHTSELASAVELLRWLRRRGMGEASTGSFDMLIRTAARARDRRAAYAGLLHSPPRHPFLPHVAHPFSPHLSIGCSL